MTEQKYNELIEEFKEIITSKTEKGLKKGDLDQPLLVLQVVDENETPSVGRIEGFETLLDQGRFDLLPTVLAYAYEQVTPVATALIARVRVTDDIEDVVIEDVTLPRENDTLFIYIETFDKECVMCWKIEPGEEQEDLINIYNPDFSWKDKKEDDDLKSFELLPDCHVYIEPEL